MAHKRSKTIVRIFRHCPDNPAGGFTLVEALVAGVLMTVIGVVAATMLHTNGRLTSGGALNAKVQMHYENAISQIGAMARCSNVVLAGGESWPPAANASTLASPTILMFNDLGNQIGGYRVVGEYLQEYSAGDWRNFKGGSDDIRVTEGCMFNLSGDRKWLTLGLSVFAAYAAQKDTVISKQEVFLCRN